MSTTNGVSNKKGQAGTELRFLGIRAEKDKIIEEMIAKIGLEDIRNVVSNDYISIKVEGIAKKAKKKTEQEYNKVTSEATRKVDKKVKDDR